MVLLEVKNLYVNFETSMGQVKAADDVSFEIVENETFALVGETGCGKSVVASSILGLLPENAKVEGEIIFLGRDLLKMSERELSCIRGKEISIMFQNPSLALNPVYPIGDQISEPLRVHNRMSKKRTIENSTNLLRRLGFQEPQRDRKMYPFQFSGGMNQRVMIAACLTSNPKIIIADEPTKGLDSGLVKHVVEMIKEVKKISESSVLLITHDLNLARSISDRIAIMYAGEILEIADTAQFFHEPAHPYSKALLGSLPEGGFWPIPGTSPSMTEPPTGCKFHPRCSRKTEDCSIQRPKIAISKDRLVRCRLFA